VRLTESGTQPPLKVRGEISQQRQPQRSIPYALGLIVSQHASTSAPESQPAKNPWVALRRSVRELGTSGLWLSLALFFGLQLIRLAQSPNGPSPDEAIHLTAGLRTWSGHLPDNRYLESLPGSLLWPVIGAAGYEAGGLAGARIVALVAALLTFLGVVLGTRRFFGDRAAFFAGIAMTVSAPFLVAAHLASMEAIALMGMSLCFWAVSHLSDDDHRRWIGFASIALGVAMLAQYRAALFFIPIAALILVLRGAKGRIDVALLGLTFVLPFIVYFQAISERVVVDFGEISLLTPHQNVHDFASVDDKRALILLWGLLPVLVGLLAWRRAPEHRRLIAVMLAGPAVWVLALLGVASLERSLVYPDLAVGLLLVYPVVGLSLSRLSLDTAEQTALAITVLLAGLVAWVHMGIFDTSWPDSRPMTDYLMANMQENDQLLVNDRWPYALALYDAGIIDNPNEIVDEPALLVNTSLLDLCAFGWFVDGEGPYTWSPWVTSIITSCGTFESAESANPEVHQYTDRLRRETGTVPSTLWRNSNPYGGTGS
jgi:Dolichyl-phosphate-mannose-protein mannosyltransferase